MALGDLLPHVNAACNALSASCLIGGYVAVRTKCIRLHKGLMLSAFLFSALFLTSYITKQVIAGHTEFGGEGVLRLAYLLILASHMLLAVPVVPLSVTLIVLGLTGRIERHRKLAHWTLPVWLYVSVTGVAVYLLLYHLAPPAR